MLSSLLTCLVHRVTLVNLVNQQVTTRATCSRRTFDNRVVHKQYTVGTLSDGKGRHLQVCKIGTGTGSTIGWMAFCSGSSLHVVWKHFLNSFKVRSAPTCPLE